MTHTNFTDSHYRKIFQSSPDGYLIVDPANERILDANSAMLEICEVNSGALIGEHLSEIKFQNGGETRFFDLIGGGNVSRGTFILKLESGKKRFVSVNSTVLNIDERDLIFLSFRDISGRRKVLDKREKQASLLAQMAGKAARLGGWSIKLPERELTWSDENCVIHDLPPGYQPTLEEGIGYYPEEYREKVIQYVEKCATDGIGYDFELPKYTAKGRLIWVRSIGEAVRDKDGNIIALQGAFQDITDRKKVEAEKEKLIAELQEALDEVKTLQQFLPLCSYCKKVRDDQNYWSQIENYIVKHTGTQFSHGICPDCYETNLAPQIEDLKRKTIQNTR